MYHQRASHHCLDTTVTVGGIIHCSQTEYNNKKKKRSCTLKEEASLRTQYLPL